MRVLAIGEMLWDVFPEQELLGGAALNFSANLTRLGDTARLVTGVGNDERGRAAIARLADLGLDTQFVQTVTTAETGTAVVTHDAAGEPSFSIARPAAYDRISIDSALLASIRAYDPQWIYTGTLFHTAKRNEGLLRSILAVAPSARVFYDMNLRPNQWNLALVLRLCKITSILKLNEHEKRMIAAAQGLSADVPLEFFARRLSEKFGIVTICVTLGPRGCFIYDRGVSVHVPGIPVQAEDTVGAGDAFSAAFLHAYERKLTIAEIGRVANALGALVASRSGATPPWTIEELHALSQFSSI